MGGLRPIGSEKLEGMDKIRRIMEIARYNETTPNPINENKKDVYTAELADGNSYSIVKEKSGYIIKQNITESTTDYIEPIQNRKYFSSYSQALKKLNLMSKEFNTLYGNDEGMSLFTEQKKKYKLKLNKKTPQGDTGSEDLPPPAPVTPPPADNMGGGDMPPPPVDDIGGGDTPPPPMDDMGGGDMGGELPPPPVDDMGGDDMGGDMPPPPMDDMDDEELPPPPMDDMDDEDQDDDEGKGKKEGGPSFKIIQKLTGKLAQKIRKYNTKDEMDSNDVKYIINSILSALDVDVLDDDDLEEIINRLEGDYEEDEGVDDEMDDEEMSDEDLPEPPMDDMGDEDLPEPPEGGEIDEVMNLSDAINTAVSSHYAGEMQEKLRGLPAVNGELDEYGMHGARKPRHSYDFKHLSHGTFGESKVDKIISSYFKESTSEKVNKVKKNIKNLSENIAQERLALKFVEKHPKSKMLGKLRSGDLVFESKSIKYKITPEAKVI